MARVALAGGHGVAMVALGKHSWGERAMRLICPSCGAQYEVDADLIPEAGRDVQCSACGHVWFEGPDGPPPETETVEAGAEAGPAGVAEPEPDIPPTFAEDPLPPVAPVRAPRRTVTPAIAEILRQEAERERIAREAEAQTALERQEELPLPEPEPEPVVVAETVIEPVADTVAEAVAEAGNADPVDTLAAPDLAGAVQAAIAAEAARPAPRAPDPALAVPAAAVRQAEAPAMAPVAAPPLPRRDRLPDIEEINSTLSPASAAAMSAGPQGQGRGGRGFRLGFGLVLLIAAALALVYVYAPRIMAAVPASEPVIAPYAAAVDSGRLWLDLRLQGLVEALGTEG